MNIELKKLLEEYGCKNPDNIKETIVSECKLSILQVRDALLLLGNILYENLDEQIYVATIKSDYGNSNSVVAVKLYKDTLLVAGYAKEGIIKQNLCEKAFQKLADAAHGKDTIKPVKSKRLSVLIIVLIILVPIVLISIKDIFIQETEIEQVLSATKTYNDSVREFNLYVEEYNEAIKLTSVDNIEGLPKSIESISVVSENRDDIEKVIRSDNSKEKIISDAETILEMTEQLKQAIIVVKQITAPTEEWVNERLCAIEEINDTQAVTEEQNPDGLLGKEGGYSACIYFTTEATVPEEVPGDSIVEKGTDAGGAVEIYANLADAEARVEYLAGFDGTALYSGSYAIIGTMVIRTSYKLANDQQLQMTNLITTELTKLSETE